MRKETWFINKIIYKIKTTQQYNNFHNFILLFLILINQKKSLAKKEFNKEKSFSFNNIVYLWQQKVMSN